MNQAHGFFGLSVHRDNNALTKLFGAQWHSPAVGSFLRLANCSLTRMTASCNLRCQNVLGRKRSQVLGGRCIAYFVPWRMFSRLGGAFKRATMKSSGNPPPECAASQMA